jgi:spore germination protein
MRVVLHATLFIFLQALPAFAQRPEALYYAVNERESIESFKANVRFIDIVGPQVYRVDSAGNFSGSVDPQMLALAKQHKVKVMPLMINTGFDQPAFHALLMNPQAQERAVRTMLALCRQYGFYGMQFDFENILVSDKDAFTAFYRKAARVLHANGFAISIAVVPRINDDPGPTSYHQWIYKYWRGVYDYKALAEAGDFISFMTYDQHTNLTPPGPVAGMPWMIQCIEFVLKSVPAEKISIGFPFYSTHWYPYAKNDTEQHTWGKQWSYPDAKAIVEKNRATIRWDEREQVNYTVFTNEALNEHIYFEDARSFRAKLALLTKYKFRGFSVWRLGNEDPEVWKVLANIAR